MHLKIVSTSRDKKLELTYSCALLEKEEHGKPTYTTLLDEYLKTLKKDGYVNKVEIVKPIKKYGRYGK